MVAATPRHVRGRLRQRSGPEPIGCTAESNQPYVLPLGADDTGSQITGSNTGRSLPPAMRGDPDGTPEAFRHTKYPNYATERSHWHPNAWRGPKAMDSVLASGSQLVGILCGLVSRRPGTGVVRSPTRAFEIGSSWSPIKCGLGPVGPI